MVASTAPRPLSWRCGAQTGFAFSSSHFVWFLFSSRNFPLHFSHLSFISHSFPLLYSLHIPSFHLISSYFHSIPFISHFVFLDSCSDVSLHFSLHSSFPFISIHFTFHHFPSCRPSIYFLQLGARTLPKCQAAATGVAVGGIGVGVGACLHESLPFKTCFRMCWQLPQCSPSGYTFVLLVTVAFAAAIGDDDGSSNDDNNFAL